MGRLQRRWRAAGLVLAVAVAGACGGASEQAVPTSTQPLGVTATQASPTTPAAAVTGQWFGDLGDEVPDGTVAPPPTTTPPAPPPAPPVRPPADLPGPAAARGVAPEPAAPGPPPRPSDPYVRASLGCASGLDAAALDRFFAERRGPVMGWDFPHAQPLPGGRVLWLFQDTFVDHGGTRAALLDAHLVRNAAVVQDGTCFTLLHRGTAGRPAAFEQGAGEVFGRRWWWPLGSEVDGDRVHVVWVEMAGDQAFPRDGHGLPWYPLATWLATYRTDTLERVAFRAAPDSRVDPIYGYATASDATHTYLFANTYQQDLFREGGFFGAHSARTVWLGRVPRGRLDLAPEYWDGTGWTADRSRAAPVSDRFFVENPLQPRFLDGRWVAVTKEDGFYGDELVVDVADGPQGPWHEVARMAAPVRRGDPRLTSYHAYPLPWRGAGGGLVVVVSHNALDALWAPATEAWMYRPSVVDLAWPAAVPVPTTAPPTTPATTAAAATTTGVTTTTAAATTVPASTTAPTTSPTTMTTTTTNPTTTNPTTVVTTTTTTTSPTTVVSTTVTSTSPPTTGVTSTSTPGAPVP